MLTVDKCCCNCSLRTGSILICVFFLFFSGIAGGAFAYRAVLKKSMTMKVVEFIMAALYGVQLVVNILLLVAICCKKWVVLFIPWILIHIIKCAMMTMGYLVTSIMNFLDPDDPEVDLGVMGLIIMVFALIIQVYFIIVVYSLYREMKNKE